MRAVVLAALLGGDADHAEAFAAWVKSHPTLTLTTDAGVRHVIGCANGRRPRFVDAEHVTCDARPAAQ